MKLEYRSKEFYERAFNFSPKIECLLQNQIYMAEMLLEIISRLDWRAKVKDPIIKPAERAVATKVIREDGHELPHVEGIGFVDDKPLSSRKAGESDFEKQKKEISARAKRSIEEEPL